MEQWHIGLSPWIIQDGNYKDFHCGEVAWFALEFYSESLFPAPISEIRADLLHDSIYRVNAKVVLSDQKVLVLDFGIMAYREGFKPYPSEAGLLGEVYLGIDPFPYFERLNKDPRMPELIYKWRIERIVKRSAPLVEGTAPDGLKALVWDESRRTEEEVPQTDAWGDEPSSSVPRRSDFAYTLICTRFDVQPTRRRSLA